MRKSQAQVEKPGEYYLRPHLYPDKFPGTRTINISAELAERFASQEKMGHLVFDEQSERAIEEKGQRGTAL